MTDSSDDFPVQNVRTMQIIAMAMLMGVAGFLVVVLFLSYDKPAGESAIISLVSAGFVGMNVLLSLVLPGILTQNALRQLAAEGRSAAQTGATTTGNPDVAKLITVRQTTMIVAFALLEGAGFFGCIAYFLERQIFVLGVVGGASLFMLMNFPTSSGVRAWLDRHLLQLADLRQTGDVAH